MRGTIINTFACQYPNSEFHGFDIDRKVCDLGQTGAKALGLSNITFHNFNILEHPEKWRNQFDFVKVFLFLQILPSPAEALKSIHSVLKLGGYLSVVEIDIHSDLKDNIGSNTATMMYQVGH